MPAGLCDRCVSQRLVPTRNSVFTLCEDPRMPRYPAVPMVRCPAFVPREADTGPADPAPG